MYSLIAALTAASVALAAVSPTSPSGDTVVRVGQPLNALWTTDGTGQWTDTVVQLMTGDNFQMIPLQVLSTGIDGTKDTEASWTTPNVTPNSKIYFLQFTQGGNVSTATWTTRFTIASADGSTTPPTNTTSGIQWGIGQLVGEDGQPIPNPTTGNVDVVAGGGSAGTSNSTASSVGAGVSSATQGSGPATISVTTSATGAAASASTTEEASASSASTSASSTPTGSASTTRAANANATSTGAAGKLVVGGWTAAVAGLVGVTLI